MACIFALKQKRIEPRTNGETHRKYAVEESFFDVVDTEAKAYWLGVGERKSFTVCPCEDIPRDLLSHYWRGLFDGDGFIASLKVILDILYRDATLFLERKHPE